jgi:hypothetical protein
VSAGRSNYRKLKKLIGRKWDDVAEGGIGGWTEEPTENEINRLEQFLDSRNFREGRLSVAKLRVRRDWKGASK